MTTTAPMDFVDSDGHVLEHPDGMLDYARRGCRDRIWHIETDDDGTEWCIYDGNARRRTGSRWPGRRG